jgi:beta-alanine degradation protein BauB
MNEYAGDIVATNFDGWTPQLRQEFIDNAHNYQVGSTLLSETDRVKVWHIRVGPGERLPAHRHVRDYFWTALTDGQSL